MKALLFDVLEGTGVRCNLCNHRCVLRDGATGICGVRKNIGSVLETLVYGRLIAQHVDPIEKKPLFHVLPGTSSYSIATVGCNFRCQFCQNAQIAQLPSERGNLNIGDKRSASQVVEAAVSAGCRSISYTYTEPTVFFEFAYDTAKLARERGLLNIFVTNGYMTREALEMIAPYLDAANVDLKGFSDEFYTHYCGAKRRHVIETLRSMKSLGVFVEITTLLIPGLNDDEQELKALSSFIASDLGPDTPWHISRFHPAYKMTDRPATAPEAIRKARNIGLDAGLYYVYSGNLPGDDGENSFCRGCGEILIERSGYQIINNAVRKNACPHCGAAVAGIEMG